MINKKKQILLIAMLIIVFIIVIFTGIFINKNNQNEQILKENIAVERKDGLEKENVYQEEQLEELIKETGKQGESDWYEVQEENDVKIATIKANIKYKVAFAGMIKNSRPNENELDDILNKEHPLQNGIWIYKEDRNSFLEYLSSITLSEYYIDESGYLQIDNKNKQNDYDKKIEKAINDEKIYSITISSKCYIVDEITGGILDYSFEDMDEYQTYEYFEDDNKILIFITENKNNKLECREIIESIVNLF